MVTVDILGEEQLLALRSDWNALQGQSRSTAVALRWEWQTAWWETIGRPLRERNSGNRIEQLTLLAVKDGSRLIGMLPLCIAVDASRRRVLRFLSSGTYDGASVCPEGMDVLCAADRMNEVVQHLRSCIFSDRRLAWDYLMLEHVWDGGPAAGVLDGPRSMRLPFEKHSWVESYFADLSNGFGSYLAALPSQSRARARRLLRDAASYNVDFEVAETPERAAAFLTDLQRLHEVRWRQRGERGAFAGEGVDDFHRRLLNLIPVGDELVLARLSRAGRPVAVLYGFRGGSRFEFYQSGVDVESAGISSPGIISHLLLMERLAARGVTTYDFLAGAAEYKIRLSSEAYTLHTYERGRFTGRNVVERARRIPRKVLSLMKGIIGDRAHQAAPAHM